MIKLLLIFVCLASNVSASQQSIVVTKLNAKAKKFGSNLVIVQPEDDPIFLENWPIKPSNAHRPDQPTMARAVVESVVCSTMAQTKATLQTIDYMAKYTTKESWFAPKMLSRNTSLHQTKQTTQ